MVGRNAHGMLGSSPTTFGVEKTPLACGKVDMLPAEEPGID
jgi:hypothetical protein